MPLREKYGIRIPQSIRQAIIFDDENNNMKWQDYMAKEIESLKKLDVFEFHPSNNKCPK